MQIRFATAAVLATGLLAGCAGHDIDAIRSAEPTNGTAFSRALVGEYRQLSAYEADEMYNWASAAEFARKGLRAADGEEVPPELLEDWKLPKDKVSELASARSRLVQLLDDSARSKVPELAAHAQGRFDCWIEQQEENHQPEHIAACRDAFYAALEEIEAAMAPPPEPAMMMEPAEFIVLFGFDSADLSAEADAVLDQAVAKAREMGMEGFSLTGHTDSAGAEDYNLALSLRRAEAVRAGLMARGIAGDAISVAGRGESEQAVPTADGVREAANRRVVIVVQ
jgi:OOP family OmpA-OmpF porin